MITDLLKRTTEQVLRSLLLILKLSNIALKAVFRSDSVWGKKESNFENLPTFCCWHIDLSLSNSYLRKRFSEQLARLAAGTISVTLFGNHLRARQLDSKMLGNVVFCPKNTHFSPYFQEGFDKKKTSCSFGSSFLMFKV